MKKIKLIPPFMVLLSVAITSIMLFAFGCDFLTSLLIILAVLIVFWFLGVIIMKIFEDLWLKEEKKAKEEEPVSPDGEVIEKEADNGEKEVGAGDADKQKVRN